MKKLDYDGVLLKFRNVHGDRYDYSLVVYVNMHTKIKIICPIHGIFEQSSNNHIRKGYGCPDCAGNKPLDNKRYKERCGIVHNNYYIYDLVDYKNSTSKVKIICPIHNVFEQNARKHLNGCGCPSCNESKGEKKIKNILESNRIDYETQKTFDGCIYKQKLKFDFYLPEYNMCIEFDGEQHFKPKKHWGGVDNLDKVILRDNIKNNYCINNGIKLIRIKYNDDVENILESYFNI
jgi:very-short-patch-repair endonuclease